MTTPEKCRCPKCRSDNTILRLLAQPKDHIMVCYSCGYPWSLSQQSTIAELQATLDAVMISVDKWLEGDALKNNPETRASDAREIALKEIDRLTIEKESAMLNGQAGLDIGLNALLRYWTLYFTGYGESSEARSLRDEAQVYFAHVMDKKHKDPTP